MPKLFKIITKFESIMFGIRTIKIEPIINSQ